MSDTVRLERELEFHDQRFSSEERRKSHRFYSITGRSAEAYRDAVRGVPAGSDLLEIGCGDHAEAWELDERGLDVTAIDISTVAVAQARDRAIGEGRWRRVPDGKWELEQFAVSHFEVLDDASLPDVVARLRAIEGSDWKKLGDPLSELRRIRHGPDGTH